MQDKLKDIESKLTEINAIISKLDPAIRLAAFEVLKTILLNEYSVVMPVEAKLSKDNTPGDVRDFYALFNPGKPADSALVLSGWFYTQRGSNSFTLEELRQLFDDVGVPMPDRIDMTLRNSARDGKKLFQNATHGSYRPTVHGENYFKSEMNLKPGKKQ